ncbi:MAG: hypothetical protein ACOYJY_02405 [Acutalibacteraceae bacterium]|jgi:hypothetical protein
MNFKKALAVVLAVIMLAALALTGCSTPRVAMTVGDKEYETADYLAYMFTTFNQMYNTQLYYYTSYYGYTTDQLWSQTFPYGEGDDKVDLELSEYIKKTTQDTIIRQKALEDMMQKYGIEVDKEELAALEEDLAKMTDSQFIDYGFTAERYKKAAIATSLNEHSLFYGLYDVGGKEGMTDEQVRSYFDENYLSYKRIAISLSGADGESADDAAKAAAKKRLEGYLKIYNQDKNFDAAIAAYNADEAAAAAATGTDENGNTTTSTTAAPTTTTTGNDTTTTTTTTTASTTGTGETETPTTTTDANLQNIEGADKNGDADFVKALREIKEGEVKIVEYKANGTTDTMALVLRLDPEKANGADYFTNSHESVIYNARYETFDKMVQKVIDELKVDINSSAVKMCDPKELFAS